MKRIMVADGISANWYIKKALANAFSLVGYPTYFWSAEGKSAHDAFVEFQPQILIASTWQLTRALVKNIIKTEGLKVVLTANQWGSMDSEIDRSLFPVEFASDNEKRYVEELTKAGVSLRGMTQFLDSYAGKTHNLWQNIGLKVRGIPTCCDITQYFPYQKDKNYEREAVFCGGSWSYKNMSMSKYLLPLTYPTWKYRTLIFGSGWSTVNNVGRASEETIRRFYSNAMVVPALFEPHALSILPDLPQRIYQTAGCKGFQIAQNAVGIREVFAEDELITVDSPEEFFEKVVYYLNHQDETESFRENSYRRVMKEHTNLHRSITLMEMINEECAALKDKLNAIN